MLLFGSGDENMLRVKNIKKSYKTGSFVQHALEGVSIDFRENEFVSILGPSGSGKTTLLNIIGGLDRYDSGDLIINEKSTKKFKSRDWDSYRNSCIGFIFQSYNLIGHLTVLDNVTMGLILSGMNKKKAKVKALKLLDKVGLKAHAHKKPNQLSGGQMQRVAIARALANDPKVILADEPTGALDSKTSVQIMELIKEIAEDKLVIMVTHNPELAKKYSTRIIKLSDGQLISDSNPIKKEEDSDKNIRIKKTKMSFITALKLSFNNIKTKKGRTLLTAFASSIGIIGIALILSLSHGFQLQIDQFESDSLAQMPVVISPTSAVVDKDTQKRLMESYQENDKSYSNKKEIYALVDQTSIVHYNKISLDYVDYIEKMDQKLIAGVMYNRVTSLNLLHKNVATGKVDVIDPSMFMFNLPEKVDGSIPLMTDNFDVIYGRYPEKENEIVVLIDLNNRINESMLTVLGFNPKKAVKFDDMLNQEFKVVSNDDYYQENGIIFSKVSDVESLYDKKNNTTLKIVGIIRGKKDNVFAKYSGTGFMSQESLNKYFVESNKNSKIVKAQTKADYNVLTGEKFDLSTPQGIQAHEQALSYIGAKSAPVSIQIYPKDFDSKDAIIEYLDKYNKGKSDEDQVLYLDMAKMISSLSSGIMNGVTIVLIAFSGISLVVSSIMIGIITYISVLERTKEIGILKALGARNKDISRVFNAETFIIGFASGIIGIVIAIILDIPISMIIEHVTDLKNCAQLYWLHGIILMTVNIVLTLVGGLIPATQAAKRDPVIALRTE